MEITGKLTQILPESSGVSASGREWVRGGFLIETEGEYGPRTVYFTAFGQDRISMVQQLPLNSPVTVYFHLESREWQERWFTDARMDRILAGAAQPMVGGYAQPPMQGGYAQPPMQGGYAQPPMQGGYTQPAAAPAAQPGFATAPAPAPAGTPAAGSSNVSMPSPDSDLPF